MGRQRRRLKENWGEKKRETSKSRNKKGDEEGGRVITGGGRVEREGGIGGVERVREGSIGGGGGRVREEVSIGGGGGIG